MLRQYFNFNTTTAVITSFGKGVCGEGRRGVGGGGGGLEIRALTYVVGT